MRSTIFTLLFSLVAGITFGQSSTLEKLSAKMESYSSIYAEFKSSLYNKQADLKVDQNGKLYVQGDKFNLDLDDYKVITDAETIWTVSKSEGEIYIDATSDQEEEDMIKPSEIFTIWKTGFKSKVKKTEKVAGGTLETITLFPTNPEDKSYHTIVLEVLVEKVEIQSMTLLGKGGDNYSYQIKAFKGNPKLPKGIFTLDTEAMKADFDIIDNR